MLSANRLLRDNCRQGHGEGQVCLRRGASAAARNLALAAARHFRHSFWGRRDLSGAAANPERTNLMTEHLSVQDDIGTPDLDGICSLDAFEALAESRLMRA